MRAGYIAIIVVLCASALFGGDNRWTSTGPFGGYFLTVAFDPQSASTVYVSGGDALYRSRNAGQLWERLDLSGTISFPAAFTVRFTPGSPSRIIAAGSSVYTSSNQGTNWEQLALNPVGEDQFYDIEFFPSNPQVLYGVTYRHGVLRSTDGGRTWAAKNSGLNIKPKVPCCDLPQLEVDPTNGNVVYALLSSRTLYKSTNGGDSWKAAAGLKFTNAETSLVIDPKNPQTLYAGGADDSVFKTTNGGSTWATSCGGCGIFSIAIDPRNTQTLYAVSSTVFKTTNGGAQWVQIPAPVPNGGSWYGSGVHPSNGAVFTTGFGTGIFRSMDGGRSWKEFTNRLDDQFIENVDSSSQRPSQIFATSPPLAYTSINRGSTWSLLKSLFMEPRSLDVHPAAADLVAAAGPDAGFAISADAGKTWSYRGPFNSVREFCTQCVQFHSQDTNTVYMAPFGAGMARSTNRGASWSAINAGLTDKNVSVIAVDPRNGSTVFVGTIAGRIFKTTNGGGSWKSSGAGLLPGYVLAITVDPSNSNVLYAAADRQPDKAFVYKSTNGGQNWTQKSRGLSPLYSIRAFAVDPSNSQTVFAAGEAGVFVSADAGENWSVFDSNGLNPFYIFDININPADPATLWMGTDRGVFTYSRKSAPGGPSITQIAPASARVGDTVLIQGSNFGSSQGSSGVSFNGVNGGAAASWSATAISVRVPSGAHSGPVTVNVNGKQSNGFGFSVLATSGNIEPASGPATGGTTVTILGPTAVSRFTLSVLFGKNVARSLRFTAPNIYTCVTPPGSGAVEVIIINGVSVYRVGTYTYQ